MNWAPAPLHRTKPNKKKKKEVEAKEEKKERRRKHLWVEPSAPVAFQSNARNQSIGCKFLLI